MGGIRFEVGFKKRRHFMAPRRTWVALILLAAVPVLVVVRVTLVGVVVAVGLRVVRQGIHLLSGCVHGLAGRGVSGLQSFDARPAVWRRWAIDQRARRARSMAARVGVVGLHGQWECVSVGRCSPTCPTRKLLDSGIQAK